MKVYETRWDFIRPHILGKKVLDIGPAELVGTVNRHKLERWIYGKIAQEAASLVGLEKNVEQIAPLVSMGYDIRQGDAEAFSMGEQYDVLVAGELIEHLSNPGQFLDGVRTHLVDGGKLLLTTPNRYSILSAYRVLRSGRVPSYKKPIAKHVVFFDSDALVSLLKRHGFVDIEIAYCKWVGAPKHRRRNRMLVEFAARHRPVMSSTLLAVAYK